MFASHLILGLCLIGFALWLQSTESKGWPNESYHGETDEKYLRRRRRSRQRVNGIFLICGVLILVASVSGPRMFVLAWTAVTLALLVIVVLAALDAIRTQRYLNKKLPELRKKTLDRDE